MYVCMYVIAQFAQKFILQKCVSVERVSSLIVGLIVLYP